MKNIKMPKLEAVKRFLRTVIVLFIIGTGVLFTVATGGGSGGGGINNGGDSSSSISVSAD